jgi:hypothetical protein
MNVELRLGPVLACIFAASSTQSAEERKPPAFGEQSIGGNPAAIVNAATGAQSAEQGNLKCGLAGSPEFSVKVVRHTNWDSFC